MCGIAGVWSRKGALDDAVFLDALGILQHRGPDKIQSIRTQHTNLGTQRLEIIGTDEGNQPISDESGNHFAFNGAIYNYTEIAKSQNISSKSDTEILFQLLLKKDINKAVEDLRGMFAFAFFNEKENSFHLVRDRLGQKPLYYYQDEEILLFASELKSLKKLLQLHEVPVVINENAIYHFLSFSNIPEPETIYKNVFAIPPAHIFKYQNGKVSMSSYWQHDYLPKTTLSFSESKEKVQHAIEESVKIRLRADVKKGLFLSGGWDSSIIALEASKHEANLQAFTVEYPFETSQNESKIAKDTAQKFGLKHEIIKIDYNPLSLLEKSVGVFDQPFADSSALPNLAIAESASRHVKVMLNGDGGDELFGGYRRYFTAKNIKFLYLAKYLHKILPNSERRSRLGFLKRLARIVQIPAPARYLLYTTDMLQDADMPNIWNFEVQNTSSSILRPHYHPDLSDLDQLMHWDRNFNLLSGILTKMDRASMAYSVEARSPFLDHTLFELVDKLPDSFKISGFSRKHILKSIYSIHLPKSVIQASKTSFEAPIETWLKNDFKELIQDLLFDPQAKIYRFVNYTEIMLMIKGVKNQDRNINYIIYSLLILEMWLQKND